MYDIVIVGAGPAGLTAAIYARRANKSVLILEKNGFGGQITSSPKVENYPGFESVSGSELADSITSQVLAQGADVEIETVTEIKDNGKTKTVITEEGNEYECLSVIIAGGENIGIELKSDGIIIVGTYKVGDNDPAYQADLQIGDKIIVETTINNKSIDLSPAESKIMFKAFKGLWRGSPKPLPKSFPDPVGMKPNFTLSKSEIPFKTSFTVPSPPTTTSLISSSSNSEILLANSVA